MWGWNPWLGASAPTPPVSTVLTVAIEAEVATLSEQVKRNSQNSSKPLSQGLRKGFKPKEQKKKRKPRGAQFGHEGHAQKFYAVEACETVKDHYPGRCIECGARLHGKDPDPYRVQQVEIPPVPEYVNKNETE